MTPAQLRQMRAAFGRVHEALAERRVAHAEFGCRQPLGVCTFCAVALAYGLRDQSGRAAFERAFDLRRDASALLRVGLTGRGAT